MGRATGGGPPWKRPCGRAGAALRAVFARGLRAAGFAAFFAGLRGRFLPAAFFAEGLRFAFATAFAFAGRPGTVTVVLRLDEAR